MKMELSVHKTDGSQSSEKVTLNDNVFSVTAKNHLVRLAVLSYMAAQRQGTHLARNRALVTGSGRKPHRQKGTGRARAGTVKSNIWRGGGKSFGPSPHLYHVGINKKEKRLARRAALSHKARKNSIVLVEDFTLEKPETQYITSVLKALKITDVDRTMLIVREHSSIMWKSCKNIKNLTLMPAAQISTYDIISQSRLVIQKGALEFMNEAFSS